MPFACFLCGNLAFDQSPGTSLSGPLWGVGIWASSLPCPHWPVLPMADRLAHGFVSGGVIPLKLQHSFLLNYCLNIIEIFKFAYKLVLIQPI